MHGADQAARQRAARARGRKASHRASFRTKPLGSADSRAATAPGAQRELEAGIRPELAGTCSGRAAAARARASAPGAIVSRCDSHNTARRRCDQLPVHSANSTWSPSRRRRQHAERRAQRRRPTPRAERRARRRLGAARAAWGASAAPPASARAAKAARRIRPRARRAAPRRARRLARTRPATRPARRRDRSPPRSRTPAVVERTAIVACAAHLAPAEDLPGGVADHTCATKPGAGSRDAPLDRDLALRRRREHRPDDALDRWPSSVARDAALGAGLAHPAQRGAGLRRDACGANQAGACHGGDCSTPPRGGERASSSQESAIGQHLRADDSASAGGLWRLPATVQLRRGRSELV